MAKRWVFLGLFGLLVAGYDEKNLELAYSYLEL